MTTWLRLPYYAKARRSARSVWHRVPIAPPRTGGPLIADCGARLDQDANTASLRLEIVGNTREVPGERCKRCKWD